MTHPITNRLANDSYIVSVEFSYLILKMRVIVIIANINKTQVPNGHEVPF